MSDILWAAPARRALREIVTYYSRVDPGLAERIIADIFQAPSGLLDFPEMGSPTPAPSVRRWRIPKLPFRLTYRVTRDGITILQVHHTAQDRA
ncbi:type II toxin-antitoxin system RelE/ParE family toxin [Sphingomonas jatrophae]|uniref:Plasmid stabilization system protein ParE n=1 Tax=Sphingomonas jatrophae TaxID=1166337 RepID=A0A1I6KXZ3_9SPHN|nr:type II toxin-antitoxin system RelE/ParE family toxin [Sphingomonas jatrophae]SFR96071.1 Plasmid stabilization system protein ParE [Sphingomonas jatrophae]